MPTSQINFTELSLRLLLRGLFLTGAATDTALLKLATTLASLVPGFMQQFVRDYGVDTSNTAQQLQLLTRVASNSDYVYTAVLRRYQSEGVSPLYAWLASATSDSTQVLSDEDLGGLLTQSLQRYGDMVAQQQAEQQQIDRSQVGLYAFANWWQGASAYIQTINPELLGSISYEHNPAQAVNTYLNSSAGDINKVHEAVVASNDGAPDLQGLAARLQIDKSQISNHDAEVLKTQRFGLAEHHIYGSSRVGVARYWPGQYDAEWNYTTNTKDTIRLLAKQPWYSGTLGGYKPAGITELYAQGVLSTATASHFLGQKQYELSNHLGNVQATLSDKRYVKKQYLSATDSLRKSFAASVSSMYDYYPFGMPMLERSTSDTGTQTAYVSQVVYSPFLF